MLIGVQVLISVTSELAAMLDACAALDLGRHYKIQSLDESRMAWTCQYRVFGHYITDSCSGIQNAIEANDCADGHMVRY